MVTLIGLIVVLQLITIASVLQKNGFFLANTKRREAIIDSCTLMDGRIVELVKTGFIPAQLVVPKFVILELQNMADGSNSDKRQRARQALEIISTLKDSKRANTIILESYDSTEEVDNQLLQLAKKRNSGLLTLDFNLIKVAQIEEIEIYNINELMQALRPQHLVGEKISVKITQKGAEKGQGVGYTKDGTMIVVNNATRSIGKIVNVEVIKHIQTASGRLVFAKKVA